MPPSEIERLVSTAIAWRVTPGGRPLIDRRRESRLARNVRIVAEYLEVECGVSFGPKGVGAVFTQVPELMLCKPTSNDRWDRRAVDLAAFRLQNGHCNVPETWEPNVELGIWVKRQRVARAAGQLSSERLKILERMGFEFGDLAQITEEWEQRFDQLIDWMLWHGEHRQTFSWVGIDWGERGGITARELALWMALQREFRRRQLLPGEAIQRFEALQVEWDSPRESQAALEWMEWLGRLVYAVERRCRAATARPAAVKLLKVPKRRNSDDDDDGDASEDAEEGGARWGGPSVAAGHTARARLGSTVASRRAAVASAPLSAEDPGLSFWVARQRWMWRQGRLPAEQVRMLNLAGVDMDAYTPTEWQAAAHTAAEVVQGSRIALGLQMDFKPAPVVEPASQPAEETIGAAEAEAPVVKPQRGRPRRQPPAVVAPTAAEEGRAKRPAIPAQPLSQPPGSLRLRTRRWVQTQRALFTDGRLSPGQLRYLAFLGITWVLSDEVTMMREDLWRRRLDLLAAASSQTNGPRDPVLQEWLQHQRGLRNLELLPPHRQAEVEALGVGWEFERSAAEDEWDLRLSQLLVQSVEEGNLNVTTANERFRGLAEWLAARMEDACRGLLPLGKVAQLKALGVAVPAPVEQVQKRGA